MIEACRQHGVILAIAEGQISSLPSMLCSFTNGGHTLSLFRLFAGAPAGWHDSLPERYSRLQTTGGWFNFDFVGSDGWISARNEHADCEMWSRHPEIREPIRRQFPNSKRPRSSQQTAIEALVKNIDQGTQFLCSGEYGREALEIAIALRESGLRGSQKDNAYGPLAELMSSSKQRLNQPDSISNPNFMMLATKRFCPSLL
mgnify:CR=1 FL=1